MKTKAAYDARCAFKQRDAYRDALLAVRDIVELAIITKDFEFNCGKIDRICERALAEVPNPKPKE